MPKLQRSGTMNILFVDDDLEVREILAEALEEFGYRVVQAASGEEALPILRMDATINLVITDIRMPGMSGIELAEMARAHDENLRIILISGYFLTQPVSQRFLKNPFT